MSRRGRTTTSDNRDDARRRSILQAQTPPAQASFDIDPLEHDHITQAVSQLSAAQAEAIRLAYYTGMTHTEIATHLNEPVGTVKSRLSAALRALRTILGGEVNQ